jgi:predicted PurR-regulated permease PerM
MARVSGIAPSRELSRLLAVIVTVVVITTLYLAKTVILPLALALLLSFVLAPVVSCLERLRVPRMLAVPMVVLAAAAVLGSFAWTVFVQLVEVTDALPAYTSNIHEKMQDFQQSRTTSFARAQQELGNLSEQISALTSELTKSRGPAGEVELGSSPDRPVSVREVGDSQGRLDAISGL